MKSIGPYKAPDSDDFQAIFFHSNWNIVGRSVLKLASNVWRDSWRIKELNDTFLCLNPKVDGVTYMKQFRPIILCNISYKVTTKMLACRIREYLPNLEGREQCAFVPKRHSHDNIVVTQEIIHSMRNKKGNMGGWILIVQFSMLYQTFSGIFSI